MAHTQIVIHVHGGIVQEVFCSDKGADLTVVDWDADALSLNDRGVVEVPTPGGSSLVCVGQQSVLSLVQLAGSETEKAILAAQARGLLQSQIKDSRQSPRYVLYDFDADELVSIRIYDSYAEAAEDAAELNNVLIVQWPREASNCDKSDDNPQEDL